MDMSELLTKRDIGEKLAAMAAEIAREAPQDAEIALVGVRRRGEPLARRLKRLLAEVGRPTNDFGVLDVTLYRDDLGAGGANAVVRGTEIDFDITGKWLVLVDDVIFTGRSARAALTALADFGRPRAVRLAVLVDRGWRELPIQPDYVGAVVPTTPEQTVKVDLTETDGEEGVRVHGPND